MDWRRVLDDDDSHDARCFLPPYSPSPPRFSAEGTTAPGTIGIVSFPLAQSFSTRIESSTYAVRTRDAELMRWVCRYMTWYGACMYVVTGCSSSSDPDPTRHLVQSVSHTK